MGVMITHYWRNEIESGYTNIIDESLTPTVEDYDAIIGMLEEAIDARKSESSMFGASLKIYVGNTYYCHTLDVLMSQEI